MGDSKFYLQTWVMGNVPSYSLHLYGLYASFLYYLSTIFFCGTNYIYLVDAATYIICSRYFGKCLKSKIVGREWCMRRHVLLSGKCWVI